MNLNNKFVITINRELGSGGRTVGRKLAEKLGVAFYDKVLIKALQKKYNLSIDEIERFKGREEGWWADLKRKFTGTDPDIYVKQSGFEPTVLEAEDMFRAETEILKDIAEEESCIIAGRTGFYIFRNHPNHLNVLIQASMPHRVARVARKQNISDEAALAEIEKVDQMRENYVNRHTDTSRYDTRNYQLVLSMDELTEDAAVDVILAYINKMNEK